VANTSISGLRVSRELDRLVQSRGRPETFVGDNATELTSNAILTWADDLRISWYDIAPGKPLQKGDNRRLASPAFGTTFVSATSSWKRHNSARSAKAR
jgi:transposase InsO family protein